MERGAGGESVGGGGGGLRFWLLFVWYTSNETDKRRPDCLVTRPSSGRHMEDVCLRRKVKDKSLIVSLESSLITRRSTGVYQQGDRVSRVDVPPQNQGITNCFQDCALGREQACRENAVSK